MGAPVESAELEFGFQLSGKRSIYVVETGTQGAIRVKVTMLPGSADEPGKT